LWSTAPLAKRRCWRVRATRDLLANNGVWSGLAAWSLLRASIALRPWDDHGALPTHLFIGSHGTLGDGGTFAVRLRGRALSRDEFFCGAWDRM